MCSDLGVEFEVTVVTIKRGDQEGPLGWSYMCI